MEEEQGGEFVVDRLGWVEVAHVEREDASAPEGVTRVELERADDIVLAAEAEEFALHRVHAQAAVDAEVFREDRVERLDQPPARAPSVGGRVLRPVGNPVVQDAGRPEFAAHGLGDPPARDGVADPERPDLRVRVREGPAVGRQRVREKGGVKVQAQAPLLRPRDPAGEVLGGQAIAVDAPAARLGVHGVEVDAVRAGGEGEDLVEVGPEFVAAARAAGVPARGQQAAARHGAGARLETGDVVGLPRVEGDGHGRRLADGPVGVHAERRVFGAGVRVARLDPIGGRLGMHGKPLRVPRIPHGPTMMRTVVPRVNRQSRRRRPPGSRPAAGRAPARPGGPLPPFRA